jgi:hypothetical protein
MGVYRGPISLADLAHWPVGRVCRHASYYYPGRDRRQDHRARAARSQLDALTVLDRSTRSQTIEEDGARVIVINTRHPLFQERKGDTWYQLETAAREVFAALEVASVAEYERRVNEVLMLAFELRGRRRRPRSGRPPQLNLLH